MTKTQMSFIVERYGNKDNTKELNSLLSDGWSVIMATAMSNADVVTSYALVILEKEF